MQTEEDKNTHTAADGECISLPQTAIRWRVIRYIHADCCSITSQYYPLWTTAHKHITQHAHSAGGLNAEWSECRTVISTISGGMPNGRNAKWHCWLICANESKYLEVVCWLCTCFWHQQMQNWPEGVEHSSRC